MSAISSLGGYDSYSNLALSGTQGRMPRTQESAQQRAEKFSSADKSQDGKLDISEFESLIGDAPSMPGGKNVSTEDMFSEIDADGDGSLTQEELDANMKKMHEQMQSQGSRVKDMLSKFDENSDGSLDETELSAMMESMPPPPPPSSSSQSSDSTSEEETESLFSSIDTNGDGTISADEFTAYTEQKRKDSNENEQNSSESMDAQISAILSKYLSNLSYQTSNNSNDSLLTLSA